MPGTNYFTPKTSAIDVALTDGSNNAMLAKCVAASIPSAVAGYGIGCLLQATDTGALYTNTGTTTSCTFTLQGDVTAGSVDTTELADGAVTLAKLDAGITPSHIVVYAGKITWSGSGASLATTVTGVASTDIVMVTIQTAPTQAAYVITAAPTTNTITIVLSAANTSNNAVIGYTVFRAAA